MRIVVGGVSGSGKSTVGVLLAERLDLPFCDGDDLHPQANIDKMRSGEPLSDADRMPWLIAIGEWLERYEGVVACSALRRTHRDLIRAQAEDVRMLLLYGDPDLIRARQASRPQHFMPPGLMSSQFATFEPLEPDEPGTTLDVVADVESLVAEGAAVLGRADQDWQTGHQ